MPRLRKGEPPPLGVAMRGHRESVGDSLETMSRRMKLSSRSNLFNIEQGLRPVSREQLAAFVKACRCGECRHRPEKALDVLLHLARLLPEDVETTIFDETAGFDRLRKQLSIAGVDKT